MLFGLIIYQKYYNYNWTIIKQLILYYYIINEWVIGQHYQLLKVLNRQRERKNSKLNRDCGKDKNQRSSWWNHNRKFGNWQFAFPKHEHHEK